MPSNASGATLAPRLDFDRHVIEASVTVDDELVVRRDVRGADQHRLDLRRVYVDATDDQHVVVAARDAQDAQMRAPANAGARATAA